MILNMKQEEVNMHHFKALLQHLPEQTDKNLGKPQSGQLVFSCNK
jgi:hypothetical protein